MKRRVLSKTTPFHAKKREREKEQNGVILNDSVPLSSSPGRAVGEERNFCFSSLILHAFRSLFACFCQKPEAQCPFIDETPRVAPCQPHPLATSSGAAVGQEVAAPHAQR